MSQTRSTSSARGCASNDDHGSLAHRARAVAVADPPTLPMSVQEDQPSHPAASTLVPVRRRWRTRHDRSRLRSSQRSATTVKRSTTRIASRLAPPGPARSTRAKPAIARNSTATTTARHASRAHGTYVTFSADLADAHTASRRAQLQTYDEMQGSAATTARIDRLVATDEADRVVDKPADQKYGCCGVIGPSLVTQ